MSDFTNAPRPSYWVLPDEASRGPAPGFAYAGFWIRLVAFLIDLIPILVVSAIVLVPVFATVFGSMSDLPIPPRGSSVDSPEYRAWQLALQQRLTTSMAQVYRPRGCCSCCLRRTTWGSGLGGARRPG